MYFKLTSKDNENFASDSPLVNYGWPFMVTAIIDIVLIILLVAIIGYAFAQGSISEYLLTNTVIPFGIAGTVIVVIVQLIVLSIYTLVKMIRSRSSTIHEPEIPRPPPNKFECETDDECGDEWWCNKEDKLCHTSFYNGETCSRDEQCISSWCNTDTYKCSARNGTEIPKKKKKRNEECENSNECSGELVCKNNRCTTKRPTVLPPPPETPTGQPPPSGGGGTGGGLPTVTKQGVNGGLIPVSTTIPGGEGGPLGETCIGGIGCVGNEVLVGTAVAGPAGGLAAYFGPKVYSATSPFVKKQVSSGLNTAASLYQDQTKKESKLSYLSNPFSILTDPVGFVTAPVVSPSYTPSQTVESTYNLANSPYKFVGLQPPMTYLTQPTQSPLTGGGLLGTTAVMQTRPSQQLEQQLEQQRQLLEQQKLMEAQQIASYHAQQISNELAAQLAAQQAGAEEAARLAQQGTGTIGSLVGGITGALGL